MMRNQKRERGVRSVMRIAETDRARKRGSGEFMLMYCVDWHARRICERRDKRYSTFHNTPLNEHLNLFFRCSYVQLETRHGKSSNFNFNDFDVYTHTHTHTHTYDQESLYSLVASLIIRVVIETGSYSSRIT